VLFLDEPTTGLDPTSRSLIWERVGSLRSDYGATIFLTTQYLEEADVLADRVAIIDHGRIVREGTPAALKAEVGADVIDIHVDEHERPAAGQAIRGLQANGELPGGELTPTDSGFTLFVEDGPGNIAVIVRGLDRAGVTTGPISVSRPTLDDVFLAATGGRLATATEKAAEEQRAKEAQAGRRSA
jgi:ABC-2 type transport system ATP-binding protein